VSAESSTGAAAVASRPAATPRLGFAGVGWIGRQRMEAIARVGAAEPAAIAEPAADALEAAAELIPGATRTSSFDDLLALDLDGIVIATPSALHARQAIAALERGISVFCQKPLGRDADEAGAVVEAAERADRLLGVDLAYRFTEAARAIRRLHAEGALGRVYAIDLTFHNAYGPDKAWFTNRELAGGGCLLDLGIHLVDLALWLLEPERVEVRSSHVLRHGRPLVAGAEEVEDHVVAELDLDGVLARLACSWWLPAGRDCVFELLAYGTEAAASIRDVGGSFYDFRAQLHRGTASDTAAEPPDGWGGRAAVAWARRIASDRSFDHSATELVRLSAILDEIYRSAGCES
jgi:predicted dehydrogenase